MMRDVTYEGEHALVCQWYGAEFKPPQNEYMKYFKAIESGSR